MLQDMKRYYFLLNSDEKKYVKICKAKYQHSYTLLYVLQIRDYLKLINFNKRVKEYRALSFWERLCIRLKRSTPSVFY